MTELGFTEIEGDGEILFAGAVRIQYIHWYIFTSTVETDFFSSWVPRRVMHAGWVALASGEVGVPADELALGQLAITWWSYFDHESNFRVDPSHFDYDDRIQYSLPTGLVAKINAVWA